VKQPTTNRTLPVLAGAVLAATLLGGCAPDGARPDVPPGTGVDWENLGKYFDQGGHTAPGDCELDPEEDRAVCRDSAGNWTVKDAPGVAPFETIEFQVVERLHVPDDPGCAYYLRLTGTSSWGVETVEICTDAETWSAQREGEVYRPVTPDARTAYDLVGGR